MNLSEDNYTFTLDSLYFYHGATGLFTCNFFMGLPINSYVVWLIASGSGGSAASELFALNLSVSEILFCISSLYMMLYFLLKMPMVAGIELLQCVLQLMFISRLIFQSSICLERYLAVVHPTVFLRFKPLRYKLACCMVDWLLMLLYCVIPTLTLSVVHVLYLLVSMSLFFLVLTLYCGVHVLCVLKQPGPGDGSRGHESRNGLKRKAFTIIVITLVFSSISHILRVLILGPALLFASEQVVLQVTLVSLSISIVSPAVRFSSFTPNEPTPPPLIGQHTVQVLRDTLSYSDDIIKTLLESRVVVQNE
ncbi:hypothetical protein GBF38_019035, partial [Nibea albiflora]